MRGHLETAGARAQLVLSFALVSTRADCHCPKRPLAERLQQEMALLTMSRNQGRQASRGGVVAGLVRAGVDSDTAARWCDLWVAEAARQGITPESEHFWDAAKGWIDAHRGSTKPLP